MKKQLATSSFIVSKTQIELDLVMVPYDIWASEVHVLMLLKTGIIERSVAKKCLGALEVIKKEWDKGTFEIDPERGAQLTLEAKIIEKAGDSGFSVHTGRSRNDQVMVCEFLYLREVMQKILVDVLGLVDVLLMLSQKEKSTIMPGYTHMQPGKATTVGIWLISYANAFLRASETLKYYLEVYDMNPLGAVESFGTSWPIDREFTTKKLGFGKVWDVTMDAISFRGVAQLGYLGAFAEIALVASKINADILLFNTYEYGMIELGDDVAQRMHPITGSSVMAQKKNPDALEIIRSTCVQILGLREICANILISLPSGYNRDAREIKEYMSLGITKTQSVIFNLGFVIKSLKINKERMLFLVKNNYSLTTDLADFISQKSKVGYRIVYKIVGAVVDDAIENNKSLFDIKADELNKKAKEMGVDLVVEDKEIANAIDVGQAIERRIHVGGSAKSVFGKSLLASNKKVKDLLKWTLASQKMINGAKGETAKLVKGVTG